MAQKDVQKYILSIPPLEIPKLRGLGSTYFYKMLEYKDYVAQTDGITGEKQTYGLVLQKSVRAAIAMHAKGFKPKDIITICSYNHLDYMVPYYASLFLGAISANLDPDLPLSDTVFLMKQVCPKLIFVGPEAVKLIEDAVQETGIDTKIVVFGNSSKHIPFREFLAPSSKENDFVPYEVEDLNETAAVIFSSGSTGLPKGICLTHYGLQAHMYHSSAPLPPGFVVMAVSNMYWISATSITVFAVIRGLNRVIYPKFDPDKIWDLIKDNEVNAISLVPHQVLEMCKNGRPEGADTSSLRYVMLVGGSMSVEHIRHARKCFPGTMVMFTYGQTEQNGRTLGFTFKPLTEPKDMVWLQEKPNSPGKALPGFTYKIVDPETEEILGPNQEGELRIKTEFQMRGYYNQDSSDVWDSDGFMKTGDIAYYDNDLCFFIVDRIKDLMKYKMWHISPVKLEAIFHSHPAVQIAVVTSKLHPVDGDHLMGLVVLKEAAVGMVSAEELRKYVDDRVGDQHKLRAGVKIVESVPVTVTDKINRRKIRQLVLQGKI